MSEWRSTGTRCPLDEAPLDLDKCAPCVYYRGASLATRPPDEPQGWRICCNWPRNGCEVAETLVPSV